MLVSIIGLLATSRRSPFLLVVYAVLLTLAFLVLLGGVVASVRIMFLVAIKLDRNLALPMIKEYGTNDHATAMWDDLHGKFLFFLTRESGYYRIARVS